MSERSSKGCLVAAVIWIIIIGGISVAAKFYILPYFDEELAVDTGDSSHYSQTVTVLADSFSGYAVLRSPKMRSILADKGIRFLVKDDGGDYNARIESLDRGQAQMAVYTVDSFVAAGVKFGSFPASIVALIDESRGADALVAYKRGVKSIQDLNNLQARIVAAENSPSEFLARTVVTRFNLPLISRKWLLPESGVQNVYEAFLKADKVQPVAFALWEPYVSLALQDPQAHVLLDSSKLSGHIIDVLVVERHFLREQPELVTNILRAYFTALNYYLDSPGGMATLLIEDGAESAMKLDSKQAQALVKGVEWKNTLQNYAAFNVNRKSANTEPLLEDGIANVVDVLENTGGIAKGAVADDSLARLFYSAPLKTMNDDGFRPDSVNVVQRNIPLRELGEAEWKELVAVGEMKVNPVSFARGTARINMQSRRELEKTAKTLLSLPGYYLRIYGNTRSDGDSEANRELALQRAQAVYDELLKNQVPGQRLKHERGRQRLSGGAGQSVTFELVQKPF